MTETNYDDQVVEPEDRIEVDEQDVAELYGEPPAPPEGALEIGEQLDLVFDGPSLLEEIDLVEDDEPAQDSSEDVPDFDEPDSEGEAESEDLALGLGEDEGLFFSMVSTAVGVGKELRGEAIDVLTETGGDLRQALRAVSAALREAASAERGRIDDGDRPSGGLSGQILSGAAEVAELAETVASLSAALLDVGEVTRTLVAEHSEGDLVFDAGLLFSLVEQDPDDDSDRGDEGPSDDREEPEQASTGEIEPDLEPAAAEPEPEQELYEKLGLDLSFVERAQRLAREVKVRMRARSRIEQIEEGLLRLFALQENSDIAEAVGVSPATVNRWSRTVAQIESEEQE